MPFKETLTLQRRPGVPLLIATWAVLVLVNISEHADGFSTQTTITSSVTVTPTRLHRLKSTELLLANTDSKDSIDITSDTSKGSQSKNNQRKFGNILILDHLNINHEKYQHEQLKAFYFQFLQCTIDPRKQANIEQGCKTLWAVIIIIFQLYYISILNSNSEYLEKLA